MRSARLVITKLLPLALMQLVMTALPSDEPVASEPFRIYVAPHGQSTNSGLSPNSPVATIESAEARISLHDVDTDVEIRIAPGTYTTGQTRWDTYIDGHTISFLPYDYEYTGKVPEDRRPVFTSDGSAGYWFWADLPRGHPGGDTGLRFYFLEVQGYSSGGLAVVGPIDKDGPQLARAGAGMNRNVVQGMVFKNIGSQHNASSTGFGGITMWNSSYNRISENEFTGIENAPHEHFLIHAVYLAHGSSHNRVESNSFRHTTGHVINVRNDSNGNLVQKNHFEGSRYNTAVYFADWSCDTVCANTYHQPLECPSHGNVFKNNTLIGTDKGKWMATFRRQPGNVQNLGPVGAACTNNGEPWLVTAGNTRP